LDIQTRIAGAVILRCMGALGDENSPIDDFSFLHFNLLDILGRISSVLRPIIEISTDPNSPRQRRHFALRHAWI